VVCYLDYLFLHKKSYSVLNTHKSMLLQTLPFFGNTWCSQTFLIQKFMKGCFHSKPPVPRYKFTWDVSIVLRFLKTLSPLHSLTLKLLTFKTIALIALATAPRAQTLVSMNLRNMLREQQAVVFTFPNLLKTTRVGGAYTLQIEHFEDESLCAMHTLLYYLKKTKGLRKSNQVFVSYVTFCAITSSTIARWLRSVLDLAGIDTQYFKAHSFRGASASAAASGGCKLQNILKTADWRTDKNFKKFYLRKPVHDISFYKAVFS